MLWAARREQMSDTLGGMWASAVVVLQNGMQWNECPFLPPACLLFPMIAVHLSKTGAAAYYTC